MRTERALSPWQTAAVGCYRGGLFRVPVEHVPLGRRLPYRRAAGQRPRPGCLTDVQARGWLVDLGQRGLGDLLLGLAAIRALCDAAPAGRFPLYYRGPRPELLRRCELPMIAASANGPHKIGTGTASPVCFRVIPEEPPTWLDVVDDHTVEVHSALPMRHYLTIEQALGQRLPADQAPAPAFLSTVDEVPFHVVFVATTSWPSRKDYGPSGFAAIAAELARRRPARWCFTIITAPSPAPRIPAQFGGVAVDVLPGLDATDCVDVFASAALVVGNDTGLTHLAALTRRSDGTGPQVVGLYSRHAHIKWTTGSDRHHAVATRFSQMLSLADRCPVRDHLDDELWGKAADLRVIPADLVAQFAGHCAGWW